MLMSGGGLKAIAETLRLDWRSWCAVGLASILAPLGVISLVRQIGWTEPDDGAVWVDAADHVVLAEVEPGGPANRSGLRQGDILSSIDEQPVGSATSAENRLWERSRESARIYRVIRNGSVVEVSLRPASKQREEAPYQPYLAIVGFFFLATGVYASLKLSRSRIVTSFSILSLSLFAMMAVTYTSRAEPLDWICFWIDLAGRLIAPAAFVHFVTSFVKREQAGKRWLVVGAYASAAGLGIMDILLVGLGRAAWTASPLASLVLADRVGLAFMTLCLAGGTLILAGSYLTTSSRSYRRQLRWMLWGAVIGLGPFTLLYLLPIVAGGKPASLAALTVLPMIVLPLAFTSALLRYRLGDLELFLKRGVATLSVIFFTLAAYELLFLLISKTLGAWVSLPGYGTRGIAVLVTAILYPPIREGTRGIVDRIFYRGRYNFRRTLVSFGRELNSELDIDALVGKIENRARQTLDLDRLALYLREETTGELVRAGRSTFGPARLQPAPSFLERVRAVSYLDAEDLPVDSEAGRVFRDSGLTTLFPMRVKGEFPALLAVGPRSGGDPLNSEDVEMLVALAGQAASAIEAARLLRQLREKVLEVERLRRTNANILESSRVGILVVDGEGQVLNCNRALEDLTGVSRDEATGRKLSDLYSLPLVREIEQLISRAVNGAEEGSPRTYRSAITNRRGERIRVNIALSPLGPDSFHASEPHASLPGIHDEQVLPEETRESIAQRGGWVATLDDVTEQVRLEERLLRQDRLAAIGLLASGVAHEVNTPLTGISSYAQILLEETDPSDPRHELLRKIERQTARASSIANSLLNFSRGGGEGVEDVTESIDLAEVIDESLALFEPQLRGGKIRILRQIERGLPKIAGHRGKLQQVLLNLLLNARDAVGDEGTVRVSLKRAAGRLVVEVSDDGCGISEEDIARVFDPFFTTKSRGKGTGLGLSLSYNIVKEHHGEIGVESRKGEGTTFTVEIPLDRRAAAGR